MWQTDSRSPMEATGHERRLTQSARVRAGLGELRRSPVSSEPAGVPHERLPNDAPACVVSPQGLEP